MIELQAAQPRGEGDGRAAVALQSRALEIARTAVGKLAASDRTLAAKMIALRFVERCAASLATGDPNVLCRWVDRACERYAGIVPACDVIAAALDVVETLHGAVAGKLRENVQGIVARPRLVKAAARHEAVDEVDVVLDRLLTELNQSDVLTAEHSRAVSSWCARLGKRLGMEKSEIVRVTRAGLIHDIGKVTTPPEILGAPRRLDDDEMAIMRRHAEEGAIIVARIPLLTNLIPGVRNHHEKFDGTGYPDGLRREAIPDIARVIAVADAFNAMIGRRPYRAPLAPSEALERLVESRGNHFDPDVVDAMVDVVTSRA
ncbi:MAG TPA: HD domain-containing phosphohydrolase [Candidatus Elarobacter sp.]|nr:HD domain-containing phosphohydrolase [Candidatus Elarobacter sp.]